VSEKKRKSYHYTQQETEFVQQNWLNMTDEDIAAELGRSVESVRRKRDELGLKKPGGRPSNRLREDYIMSNPTRANLATLSKEKKIEFYKKNFGKNARYPQLLKELNPDELEYYKHKYIEFVDSVDTLTINEEDMLHHMIMSDILIHRLRATMKKEHDDWDSGAEHARPPQNLLPELERAEQRYMKYHKELNITREQRLKTEKEEKVTIASIVRSYQEKQAREEAGRNAAVLQYYKDKCREDMSAHRYLLGE
jgi:hypothetical protein